MLELELVQEQEQELVLELVQELVLELVQELELQRRWQTLMIIMTRNTKPMESLGQRLMGATRVLWTCTSPPLPWMVALL